MRYVGICVFLVAKPNPPRVRMSLSHSTSSPLGRFISFALFGSTLPPTKGLPLVPVQRPVDNMSTRPARIIVIPLTGIDTDNKLLPGEHLLPRGDYIATGCHGV